MKVSRLEPNFVVPTPDDPIPLEELAEESMATHALPDEGETLSSDDNNEHANQETKDAVNRLIQFFRGKKKSELRSKKNKRARVCTAYTELDEAAQNQQMRGGNISRAA